jgi:hypothetical protein
LFSSWSCSKYSSSSSSTSQTCAQKVSQTCTHKRVMKYADNVGETSLRRDNLPNNSEATNEISLLCNTQGDARPSLCNAMHRNPNPNYFLGREPKTRFFFSHMDFFAHVFCPLNLHFYWTPTNALFTQVLVVYCCTRLFTRVPHSLHKMLTKYNSARK